MDNPTRGIAYILGATLCFSISDAMAKVLGNHVPVLEIGWIRYLAFMLIVLAVSARQRRLRLRVTSVRTQVVRAACMVGSMLFFIFALRFLPIADASAIGFVSPLMITALSVPMLGEVVGIRRWTAIFVGLLGVLIVIRPGTTAFQPAALLVIGSSLVWSVASILTRRIAGRDDPAATMLWTGIVGVGMLTCAAPFGFIWPGWGWLALNMALGVIVTIGQYYMVHAYRYAGAALLAPFSYVQLLWATISGYVVFDALPDRMTLVGAAIITASGLYTIHRERVRARERAAA
jgi:drug/metabolite transporter (DMT)-like permease